MDQESLSVLIVDDNKFIHKLIGTILGKDFNLTFAYKGYEALLLIEQTKFDILIIDKEMPGMNGIEVMQLLKSQKKTSPTVNIMLTGNYSDEDFAEALDLGIDRYVLKGKNEITGLPKLINELFQSKTTSTPEDERPMDVYEASTALRHSIKAMLESKSEEEVIEEFAPIISNTLFEGDDDKARKTVMAIIKEGL